MITFPNAKINLGLDVVERRPDGYHNLETIFYPIPLQDILEITPAEDDDAPDYAFKMFNARFDGSDDDNLVVKAYKILDIADEEIGVYFFAPKVRKTRTDDELTSVEGG